MNKLFGQLLMILSAENDMSWCKLREEQDEHMQIGLLKEPTRAGIAEYRRSEKY